MKLDLYQVDAFTDKVFSGNPAAVVPLTKWIDERTLQQIANENNLSETAFFVGSNGQYHIRWFTPLSEVDLCGHATLATAHVLIQHLGEQAQKIDFNCRRGLLQVTKRNGLLQMDFPADHCEDFAGDRNMIEDALKTKVFDCLQGSDDIVAVLHDESAVAGLQPDQQKIKEIGGRGLLATAPGDEVDFVSRCFFPAYGIDEDPVTGSAHTLLTPYWASRLDKPVLSALQISTRGGSLACEDKGNRVLISGNAATYLIGRIEV